MTLRMNGSTSGYVELDCQATGGNNNIKLPTSNGSANQFLKNGNTPGTLGWSSMVEDSSGNVNIDSGTVYIDAVNNRLGVGTTTPDSVFGIGNTQAGTRFFFDRSTYSDIFGGFRHNGDSGGFDVYNVNASADRSIRFLNGTSLAGLTERMRITAAGSVCISRTGTISGFNSIVAVDYTGASAYGIVLKNTSTTTFSPAEIEGPLRAVRLTPFTPSSSLTSAPKLFQRSCAMMPRYEAAPFRSSTEISLSLFPSRSR